MKWYFACNDRSRQYDFLIKAAVESALRNTSLKPHCIYDSSNGGGGNPFIGWLLAKGVHIIKHKVSFYDALEKHAADREQYLNIASGAFLRCDIPIINTEDDFVLYTDCDVIFLKDFDYQNLEQPEYFSCSSEIAKDDFVLFNTGVMYMNLKKLRESHKEFTEFITANFNNLAAFDQGAYQMFYGSKVTKLPIKYNYKPYWSKDESAVILHFHGPKPFHFVSYEKIQRFPQIYKDLVNVMPKNYLYYLELFKQYNPDIEYSNKFLDRLSQLKDNKPYFRTPLKIHLKDFVRKNLIPLLSPLSNRKNS